MPKSKPAERNDGTDLNKLSSSDSSSELESFLLLGMLFNICLGLGWFFFPMGLGNTFCCEKQVVAGAHSESELYKSSF